MKNFFNSITFKRAIASMMLTFATTNNLPVSAIRDCANLLNDNNESTEKELAKAA